MEEKVLLLEDRRFYVYIYLDPRKPGNYNYGEYHFDFEPFYVGKGSGYRAWSHLQSYMLKETGNLRINKFRKIINNGYKIEPIIIKTNILEKESFYYEKLLIKLIGRYDKNKGPLVNQTDGGEGTCGTIFSKEAIEKMRQANLGRRYSNEINKKKGRKGRLVSEETKEKHKQYKVSEEVKRKQSKNKEGNKNPRFGKPAMNRVKVIYVNENKEFNSLLEAGEYTNRCSSDIHKCCSGKVKSIGRNSGNKFYFMYVSTYISLSNEEKKQLLSNFDLTQQFILNHI